MKRLNTRLLLCLSALVLVSSTAFSKERHWAKINSDGSFSKENNPHIITDLNRRAKSDGGMEEIPLYRLNAHGRALHELPTRDTNSTVVGTPPATSTTTNASTSVATSTPSTGTPSTGAKFSIINVLGNGCAANPATIQGNTVFLTGATASAGTTMTCTIIIGVQNGETLKDLTFVHSIDMLLGRKVQHWCYLDWSRSFCVRPQWPYDRCDNCIFTTMGNQYYVASFDATYSGCGIDAPQHISYPPQGSPQSSWRYSTSVRQPFKPRCDSDDTFSVTISHSVGEQGDSLGSGWNYESGSYIAEHTLSLSKAPPNGSFGAALSASVWVTVAVTTLYLLL